MIIIDYCDDHHEDEEANDDNNDEDDHEDRKPLKCILRIKCLPHHTQGFIRVIKLWFM